MILVANHLQPLNGSNRFIAGRISSLNNVFYAGILPGYHFLPFFACSYYSYQPRLILYKNVQKSQYLLPCILILRLMLRVTTVMAR